jgi:hypothetical protein
MANTFELIASSTVVTPASTIDFTSIPSTFTDLCVKYSARGTGTSDTWDLGKLRFNGSSSGYTTRYLQGNGSAAASNNDSSDSIVFLYMSNANATANSFSSNELYIPNYAGSSYKSVSSDFVVETNATATLMGLVAGLWSNTAAINQLTLYAKSGFNFAANSTAYLYGVNKNA